VSLGAAVMQTYSCTCGNRLYFDNSLCLACQREVGWCEACARMTALEPIPQQTPPTDQAAPVVDYRCSHTDCRKPLRKCSNYAIENICNRCYAADPNNSSSNGTAVSPDAPVNRLCNACQLTETIPDLSVAGNREKWARLEAAKRRLIYTLDRLGLPYFAADPRLTFDFKSDAQHPTDEWRNAGPSEIVYTGHAGGKITINIREADDAIREQLRVQFLEAQRTLIGHFHHEVGHYYWELLVRGRRLREFRKLFGDETAPPYADAMAAYYLNGPGGDWPQSYISAYASAHSWEDFAETFALYLDMASVLDTAAHLFKPVRVNFRSRTVQPLVERFQLLGILVNEFNRTVGLIDLVPEVIATPVVHKLEFIHSLVKQAARRPRLKISPPIQGVPKPAQL
jgi:hypothetical protein